MKHQQAAQQGFKGLVFALSLSASALAAAQTGVTTEQVMGFRFFETKPYLKDMSRVYVGAGFTNDLIHGYTEAPTRYGNVYAKVGRFFSGNGFAGQAGWRYPYAIGENSSSGVYVGGFVGHVSSDSYAGNKYNRLGAAAELSWLRADKQRLSVISLGLGFGQGKGDGMGNNKDRPTPVILFGYSLGVGL